MTRGSAAAAFLLLAAGTVVSAHRLDEYLQATTISVEKDRVHAELRLTPGVAVFPTVLSAIDTDADGSISPAEERAYADRVLHDLALTVDGDRRALRLVSTTFAAFEEMREGRGEVQLEFDATVPRNGPKRTLVFENHHQSAIGVYLVNCLVPSDPDIRVIKQNRNYQQSFYQLDYLQTGAPSGPLNPSWWSGLRLGLSLLGLLLLGRLIWYWRRHVHTTPDRVRARSSSLYLEP